LFHRLFTIRPNIIFTISALTLSREHVARGD
jgi:hypothetical protein